MKTRHRTPERPRAQTAFWCFLGGRGSIGMIFGAALAALAIGGDFVAGWVTGAEVRCFEAMIVGPFAICCAGYGMAGLLRLRRVVAIGSELWLDGLWGSDRLFRALGVATRLIVAGSSVYSLHCAGEASPRDRARQIERQAPGPKANELRFFPSSARYDGGALRGSPYALHAAILAVCGLSIILWVAVPMHPDEGFWGPELAEVLASAHGDGRTAPALRLLLASGTCIVLLTMFRTVLVLGLRAGRRAPRKIARFLVLEDPPELRLDVDARQAGHSERKARGCGCPAALATVVLLILVSMPLLTLQGIASLETIMLVWLSYRLARHVATLCSRVRWLEVDSSGARLLLDARWHDVTGCESDGARAVLHIGMLPIWLSLPAPFPAGRAASLRPLVQLVRGSLAAREHAGL